MPRYLYIDSLWLYISAVLIFQWNLPMVEAILIANCSIVFFCFFFNLLVHLFLHVAISNKLFLSLCFWNDIYANTIYLLVSSGKGIRSAAIPKDFINIFFILSSEEAFLSTDGVILLYQSCAL